MVISLYMVISMDIYIGVYLHIFLYIHISIQIHTCVRETRHTHISRSVYVIPKPPGTHVITVQVNSISFCHDNLKEGNQL